MQKLNNILGISFLVLTLFACQEKLDPTFGPEKPTKEPNSTWGSELRFECKLNSEVIQFINLKNDVANTIDSANFGVCDSFGLSIFRSQMFKFSYPTDTNKHEAIHVEFLKCAPFFVQGISKDSTIYVGSMPYGSVEQKIDGVVVTYIDKDSLVWKSSATNDVFAAQASSGFVVSDTSFNYEVISEYLISGTLNCVLFDSVGNTLNLSDGKFTSRVGRTK
jgi:hypothetical protein